jgi:orotate phosphoribosyltransferase
MSAEEHRARLLALLTQRSFARRKVILASGKESDFFIDCKQTVLTAEGHTLVGELMADALALLPRAVAVAGVELGGCPLASAVSLTTFRRGDAKDALYVRKAAKDHGSQRLVEGNTLLHPDAPVVVLEDVITTGGSTLRAIETLSAAGCRVVGVVALVDRLEGGAEAIRSSGVPVHALYTREDFLPLSPTDPR